MEMPIDVLLVGLGGAWLLYRRWQVRHPAALPVGKPEHFELETPVGRMPIRKWLRMLNDQADAHPHLLVAGKSGSGKTTLARAVLTGRTGEIVIINPKGDMREWAPLGSVSTSADGTYQDIAEMLTALYQELQRRTGAEPPLTVVLDDVSSIAQDPHTKDAYRGLIRAVARLGRTKHMRLVVLAHETTAVAMGLPGEAALLENFTRVDVQKGTHQATLTTSEGAQELDTRDVPRLAQRNLALSEWHPPETVSGDVSGVATATKPDETVAFHVVARLVQQGLVSETKAIEAAFGVRAGSSSAYQRARAGVKAALEECQE
jgi:energy-coupling factor transporter ATP-binding protein EcfA2